MSVLISHGSLGGATLRSRALGGFTVSETRHPPSMRLPRHANDRATLVAVLDGAYVETSRGRTGAHTAGTVLVRPAGEVHSNALDGRGSRCLLVEVGEERLDAPGALHDLFAEARVFPASAAGALARRAGAELAAGDAAAPLALEALVLEMVAWLARGGDAAPCDTPPWLDAVRQALHEAREPVSLAALAREAGHSPAYVARAFRRRHGCTVGEYARRVRVERARDALAGSDLPLARVALEAGFCDQSHFSRVFRRLTGLTPAEYRRLYGQVNRVPGEDRGMQDGEAFEA